MAENNDDQYLDELLNSLRSSNDDGSDALSDKNENLPADAGQNNRDDKLIIDDSSQMEDNDKSQDNTQNDDDIFALEDNGEEQDVNQPIEEDNEDYDDQSSANGSEDNDSLMDMFNQLNGDVMQTDGSNADTDASQASSDAEQENGDDNAESDIITLTDDEDNSKAYGEPVDDDSKPNADNQPNKEDSIENTEKLSDAKSAAKNAKEEKAEAARKEKEAKKEEKERKKAEKKAKKEQKKAEKAAKKNKNKSEPENESVDGASQGNVDLIDRLYNDEEASGGSSDDDLDSIPEREEETKPKKKKEKKKKEPKPKKPKKEKVKKEKKPAQPSELVKVTKGTFIGMFITIVLIVGIVYLGTSFVSYGITVSQAKEHFNNGKFDQAFDSISGINIRKSDENTYYAIRTVASVYVDYCSYINYDKAGMKFEALDALIKGLQHYDEYYSDAEKYEVLDQYDAVKNQILSELSSYGISEDDAVYYGSLENEQQYREILSDIGEVTE